MIAFLFAADPAPVNSGSQTFEKKKAGGSSAMGFVFGLAMLAALASAATRAKRGRD